MREDISKKDIVIAILSPMIFVIGLFLTSYLIIGITTGEWNPYQMYLDYIELQRQINANVTAK